MIYQLNDLRIRTDHWAKPGPVRSFDWTAVDDANYDGAEDSRGRSGIGYGATETEAVIDLLKIIGTGL